MKKFWVSFLIHCIIFTPLVSQNSTPSSENTTIIGVYPSKIKKVNGIMFNVFSSFEDNPAYYPTVNGLEINIDPLTLMTTGMALFHAIFDAEARQPLADTLNLQDSSKYKIINGISIGFNDLEPYKIRGLEVKVGGSFGSKTKGVTLSGIMNKHLEMKGVTIALIGNFDVNCNGVQIGLFNKARRLRGFQFGLWNKNEKRSLPFINWNFSKAR